MNPLKGSPGLLVKCCAVDENKNYLTKKFKTNTEVTYYFNVWVPFLTCFMRIIIEDITVCAVPHIYIT